MTLKNTIDRWKAWRKGETAAFLAKVLRYVLLIGILGYLIYELTAIGWLNVYEALPTNPWFYVIFVILYLALPISELFIYGLSLKFKFWQGLKVFCIKKMLNADVLGYSGEAYLYIWAKKHLKESDKEVFNVIKDNNIISSFASTLMAIILLSVFTYFGDIDLGQIITIDRNVMFLIIGLVIVAIMVGFYFRKQIISADTKTALTIFGTHQTRIACLYLLEALQWSIVLPLVPFHIWLTFLSVKIIVSRIPFMPSADLLFVGLSLELSKYMDIPQDAIAGMMLATNVLNKLVNLGIYVLFFLKKNPEMIENIKVKEA